MKTLLKSKKFWVTAIGVAGVIAGKYFGVDDATITAYTKLIGGLVMSIAGVDVAQAITGQK